MFQMIKAKQSWREGIWANIVVATALEDKKHDLKLGSEIKQASRYRN